jgi:predicted Mrr-cat superfamily restriction endonuclease
MNYSTAVFLINKHVRALACTYEQGDNAPRTIFKTLDEAIKAGDFVVVPTDTRHNMTVVKVVEPDVDVDFDSSVQVKWIIGKVDRAAYEQTLAQEAAAIQEIKRAELRKKREDLAGSLLANHLDTIKALPIAAMNGEAKSAAAAD